MGSPERSAAAVKSTAAPTHVGLTTAPGSRCSLKSTYSNHVEINAKAVSVSRTQKVAVKLPSPPADAWSIKYSPMTTKLVVSLAAAHSRATLWAEITKLLPPGTGCGGL